MHGIKKIGHVVPKKSSEIAESRFGIGLEKLDRNLYNPEPAYDPLAEIGVKYVRIQSGWARTEKEEGSYDFTWLDSIVDNLVSRGMIPWICLCYGNPIYTESAKGVRGAIGCPPIFSEREEQAWDKYVEACVGRYRGKVNMYEVWNEPDGQHCWRHGVNAGEYGRFVRRTSAAIRRADPDAKVLAGSFFSAKSVEFLYTFLKELEPGDIDYITYHQYQFRVDTGIEAYARAIKSVLSGFDPGIGIIQGETGAQSRFSRQGALNSAEWTERKQAKFLLRKMMIDLKTDVLFTSYFTSVDVFENIIDESGTISEDYYGFFGVLGEKFDKDGRPIGEYYKKDSYTAYQSLCATLSGKVSREELPLVFEPGYSSAIGRNDDNPYEISSDIIRQGFRNEGGAAFVYWSAKDIMTQDYESTVSINAYGLPSDVKLVDLYTGEVFVFDSEHMSYSDGVLSLRHIPIRDYPLMLTFGDFCDINRC